MDTLVLPSGTSLVLESEAALFSGAGDALAISATGGGSGGGGTDPPAPVLPGIAAFTVTQEPGFPLVAVATWETDAALVVLDWGDGGPEELWTDVETAAHVYGRTGLFVVTLTAAGDAGRVTETRNIAITLDSGPGKTLTRCTSLSSAVPGGDGLGGLV